MYKYILENCCLYLAFMFLRRAMQVQQRKCRQSAKHRGRIKTLSYINPETESRAWNCYLQAWDALSRLQSTFLSVRAGAQVFLHPTKTAKCWHSSWSLRHAWCGTNVHWANHLLIRYVNITKCFKIMRPTGLINEFSVNFFVPLIIIGPESMTYF